MITNEFGKGLLFGNITGVPPTDVVILGLEQWGICR
jgi:alanine dehydrogenase